MAPKESRIKSEWKKTCVCQRGDKDGGGGECLVGAIENTEWGQLKSPSDIEKITIELVRKCETNVPSSKTLNGVEKSL